MTLRCTRVFAAMCIWLSATVASAAPQLISIPTHAGASGASSITVQCSSAISMTCSASVKCLVGIWMIRTIGTGSITPPPGYSLVPNTNIQTPAGRTTGLFVHVYSGGDTLQPQFEFSGSGGVEYICAGYSGVDPNVPINASAGLSNPSSMALTAPSVDSTTSYGSLLMLYATDNSGTFSLPSAGFIDATDQNNGRGLAWVDAWPMATGATGPQTVNISTATTGVGVRWFCKLHQRVPRRPRLPTPTATPTPTPGTLGRVLGQAVDTVRSDLLPAGLPLCATQGTELCTRPGSATLSAAGNDSTDDTAAFNTALSAGDVDVPAKTYRIHGTISMPSTRTLHCEPGTILHSDTGGNIISLSSTSRSTIMGCAFHNGKVNVSGGSDNLFIGNTFDIASPFTLTGSTSDNVVELNDFQAGAPSVGGDANVMYWVNRVSGIPTMQTPILLTTSGAALQNHFSAVLNFISYGATFPSSGNNNGTYKIVQPGSVFGGATCHGDGTTDDTACIYNAMGSGNQSLFIKGGTYLITGDNDPPNATNILCQPGTVLFNGNNSPAGIGGGMLRFGYTSPNSGNDTVLNCKLRGTYDMGLGRVDAYDELLQVGDNGNPQNFMFAGLELVNAHGDGFITYQAAAGLTNNPRDVSFLFNWVHRSDQPGEHINGGTHIHSALNLFENTGSYPESDSQLQQEQVIQHLSRVHATIPDDGFPRIVLYHAPAALIWARTIPYRGASTMWRTA